MHFFVFFAVNAFELNYFLYVMLGVAPEMRLAKGFDCMLHELDHLEACILQSFYFEWAVAIPYTFSFLNHI